MAIGAARSDVEGASLGAKAKGILMQCRKAVGPTWGFTPKTMKWIYTAVVRPSLSYGAVIWINGLKTKKNITLLNSVQRLANILISGALPGNALNKINDIIPIDNWIEEEALTGTLRLKANGHWIRMPMVNTRGKLTSHTKILDRILNTIPLSKEDQDSMTTTYNLDPNFAVDTGHPNKGRLQRSRTYQLQHQLPHRWLQA